MNYDHVCSHSHICSFSWQRTETSIKLICKTLLLPFLLGLIQLITNSENHLTTITKGFNHSEFKNLYPWLPTTLRPLRPSLRLHRRAMAPNLPGNNSTSIRKWIIQDIFSYHWKTTDISYRLSQEMYLLRCTISYHQRSTYRKSWDSGASTKRQRAMSATSMSKLATNLTSPSAPLPTIRWIWGMPTKSRNHTASHHVE